MGEAGLQSNGRGGGRGYGRERQGFRAIGGVEGGATGERGSRASVQWEGQDEGLGEMHAIIAWKKGGRMRGNMAGHQSSGMRGYTGSHGCNDACS